jgi:hypothetical protein
MSTYKNIPSHFSFTDVYDRVVAGAPEPAVFVEVGTWYGASTVYLAEKIKDSGKRIKFYAIDNFTAVGAGPVLLAEAAKVGGDFYRLFCRNLKKCGVAEYVQPLRGDSTLMAGHFADDSLDFVYIDACHRYKKVKQDILAWLPKVKNGGVLAGHDYDPAHPGVVRAVEEIFGKKFIKVMTHSWVLKKTWARVAGGRRAAAGAGLMSAGPPGITNQSCIRQDDRTGVFYSRPCDVAPATR